MGFSAVSMGGKVVWKREHHAHRRGEYGYTLGVECGYGVVMVSAWSDNPGSADVVHAMRCTAPGDDVVVTGHIVSSSYEKHGETRWTTKVYPTTFDVERRVQNPVPTPHQTVEDAYRTVLERRIADLERSVREAVGR